MSWRLKVEANVQVSLVDLSNELLLLHLSPESELLLLDYYTRQLSNELEFEANVQSFDVLIIDFASIDKSRASVVAMRAEIRRTKASFLEEIAEAGF
ncbi:hypothetical protein QQ045_018928 [Rhodiola kirilowii]